MSQRGRDNKRDLAELGVFTDFVDEEELPTFRLMEEELTLPHVNAKACLEEYELVCSLEEKDRSVYEWAVANGSAASFWMLQGKSRSLTPQATLPLTRELIASDSLSTYLGSLGIVARVPQERLAELRRELESDQFRLFCVSAMGLANMSLEDAQKGVHLATPRVFEVLELSSNPKEAALRAWPVYGGSVQRWGAVANGIYHELSFLLKHVWRVSPRHEVLEPRVLFLGPNSLSMEGRSRQRKALIKGAAKSAAPGQWEILGDKLNAQQPCFVLWSHVDGASGAGLFSKLCQHVSEMREGWRDHIPLHPDVLDLAQCFWSITELVAKWKLITRLDLRSNGLPLEDQRELGRIFVLLDKCPNLKRIDLSGNEISEAALQKFGEQVHSLFYPKQVPSIELCLCQGKKTKTALN